uniref:Uncharacterized protein n=1 Tax=Arundo donax TaxID=35708 RepID=A0A0A8Y5F3_ARUDO
MIPIALLIAHTTQCVSESVKPCP